MDLVALDRILQEEVVGARSTAATSTCDIPDFAYGRTPPTCEAIAAHVYPRVAARLPAGVTLERVRIAEDPTLYAECTGAS